jgi:hypothetical protein
MDNSAVGKMNDTTYDRLITIDDREHIFLFKFFIFSFELYFWWAVRTKFGWSRRLCSNVGGVSGMRFTELSRVDQFLATSELSALAVA